MDEQQAGELSRQTRRVLEAKGWSLRRAQRETKVNYSVIHSMVHDGMPLVENLYRWADAIGENRNSWLAYAGYRVVPTQEGEQPPVVQESRTTYEPFIDEVIEAGWSDITDPEERAEVLDLIRRKREKIHRRNKMVIGKRAE